MKFTGYFLQTRQRPDRAMIELEWIRLTIEFPDREQVQSDGRIRRWRANPEMDGRYLRVILLPDGETVHNAFLDMSYRP